MAGLLSRDTTSLPLWGKSAVRKGTSDSNFDSLVAAATEFSLSVEALRGPDPLMPNMRRILEERQPLTKGVTNSQFPVQT
jgi:hypothetical protein